MANEAERSENVPVTEKSYGVHASKIRRWINNYQRIMKFAEKSRTRITVHHGRKFKNPNLENGRSTVSEENLG